MEADAGSVNEPRNTVILRKLPPEGRRKVASFLPTLAFGILSGLYSACFFPR